MTLIICLDDKNGYSFNNRRQSQDKEVIKDILNCTSNGRLLISEYSKKLFDEYGNIAVADENFLTKAEENDFCFVENIGLNGFEDKISKIIAYRWNRAYPSDKKLFLLDKLKLIDRFEFPGSSHEKITREVYIK